MNIQNISPFKGLDMLKFGEDRISTREKLGSNYITFSRINNDEPEVDYYENIGLQLNFDKKKLPGSYRNNGSSQSNFQQYIFYWFKSF